MWNKQIKEAGLRRMRGKTGLRHEVGGNSIILLAVLSLLFLSSFGVLTYESQQESVYAIAGNFSVRHAVATQSRGIAHGVIHINGNADFANQAQQEGWQGNGTEENPYLIEGYDIGAKYGAYCIWIENTTVWFVIRNCRLWGATSNAFEPYGTGIFLKNVENGTLENNNCSGNSYAIYLSFSNHTRIAQNNCSGSLKRSIWLYSSSSNNITGNNCSGASLYGISIECTTNNTLKGNIVSSNAAGGIYVQFSNSTVILSNTCSENSGSDISIYSANDSYIENNTGRISVSSSSNNTVVNNTGGISINSSSNNTIAGNTGGVFTTASTNNTIANNTGPISIISSSNSIIQNNVCSCNLDGMSVSSSINVTIINNNCSGNFRPGISIWHCSNCIISNNNCSGGGTGIDMNYLTNATITNNVCLDNSRCGISLSMSNNTAIMNNTLGNGGLEIYGHYLENYNSHAIENNTVNGKPVYYYKNQNGGTVPSDAGQVILANCTNMRIAGFTFTNLSTAINLGFSAYNIIMDNHCYGNRIGILLVVSINNTIMKNNCSGNSEDGISLEASSNNTIADNNCSGNSKEGISLEASSSNIIADNNCSGNSEDGISLEASSNNTIADNHCSGNLAGIYIEFSHNTTIANNTCSGNLDYAIYLSYSRNQTITNNTIWNSGVVMADDQAPEFWNTHMMAQNTVNGKPLYYCRNQNGGIVPSDAGQVILANCTNMVISGVSIDNASAGIQLGFSSRITIMNTTCSGNSDAGIKLFFSCNNTIYSNNCSGNRAGIHMLCSDDNTITGNTCSSNSDAGITLYEVSNNSITNNNCSYNSRYGIVLDYSSSDNITNNNCSSNSWYGIYLDFSGNNNITCNNFYKNKRYGLSIEYDSTENTIHHNNFWQNNNASKGISGNCQAHDNCSGNCWYDNTKKEGNYWSNWDGNGWGTASAYPIAGLAGASDYYPLSKPVGIYTVPSPPQNLTAIAGNGNVTLSWEPPVDNGGMTVTNYTIYYGTSSGNYTTHITVGNLTTWTITNLTNGQRYYFTVSAMNAVGESPESNEVSAMPCTMPSPPQNLTAIAGEGNITLSWEVPEDSGGMPITNYKIYYGTTPGNYTWSITAGNVTSYTITNLSNGQTYYFAVSAINGVGEGARSNEASAVPQGKQIAEPRIDLIAGICVIGALVAILAFWIMKKKQKKSQKNAKMFLLFLL